MSGYDATAHIAEEIKQPEIKTPWAISLGMLFTYIAGWLYNIVLCFVMGNISAPNSIIHSPIEQLVAQIFYNVLGKSGSVFYTICALIILKFGNFAAMQSLTRTIFALSRDKLVPFSDTWTTISPSTGIPIYAVWLSALWAVGINLIGLGSHPAIAGVFNTTAIALDWSFCIPIFCKILFGKFEPGPWPLGRFSTALNVYACAWTMFVSFIFLMPTTLPVRAETMNYAVVYIVAILLFATLYWVVRGKEHYTGPRIEVSKDTINDEANESRPGQSKPPRGARQVDAEPTETRPLLGGT
ncbi:hypothetical protein PRZ48_008442 [Zasmidium cellare]|uniref:Amino acid transporter n=1 Tax=Zasmidium cellare TaxID=395010 RepID=A0ABR0EGC1_ZASCE|nr:hypothetical protein PRZ48_008442 [Zasmidium cellare]